MTTVDYDYMVIGSGMAGLIAALELSPSGRVALLSKRSLSQSNTNWAQGGISCVMDPEDSLEAHVQDTLAAGGGLCHEAAVRAIIHDSFDAVACLERHGVTFSKEDVPAGERRDAFYDLGREAGHSARRVLHAGDITGHEVIKALLEQALADPNITLMSDCMAIDLVTTGWLGLPGRNRCIGAYFLNSATGEIFAVRAPYTILATGGAGKVYLYTSNPDLATGDGIAMAWRAGLPIKNMEFIQFHPTCLYHPEAKSFLISEAVRGEGGILINAAGESFTERFDPRGSLAPRDIVARAIDQEMKTRGDRCVYLDITHHNEDFLTKRFPNIYATCLKYGIDMAKKPIPVVPAAHYCCGGVEADVNGVTALDGLYAVGETACTGMHGANRLASNSLLEALVCARRAARAILEDQAEGFLQDISIPDWHYGDAVPSDEVVVLEHNWNEVRTCMWDYVGIVRTDKRLDRAFRRIQNLRREIRQYYLDYLVTTDVLELRNIAAVADLIVRSAMSRKESRGLHYTLDYPEPAPGSTVADTRIMDVPGAGIG